MIGTNTLKAKLRKGEGVLGAFNALPSPDTVEILGSVKVTPVRPELVEGDTGRQKATRNRT